MRLKDKFLCLGIKAKLSLLTGSITLITLIITLSISSYREIEFKKVEAKKLMIHLGKQMGLMKSLSPTLTKDLFSEYLTKTVSSSFERRGYAIDIVYIISTDPSNKIEIPIFNWKILSIPSETPEVLAEKILKNELKIPLSIQSVTLEIPGKGNLHIGFSMQILKSEILINIFQHLLMGLILMGLGIGTAIWLAGKITQPLFALINGFQNVSKGDLQTRVNIQTHDELEKLATSFNEMTLGLRERDTIKDIFRRYATEQVVEKILKGEVRPTLSGERREVTVLFSDIRMFTSIAAKLSPEKIVYLLNRYFTAMTDVVLENEGLIDKFTGDEMMVVFGAPIHHPDDPQRALKTAFKMFEQLKIVNENLIKEGYPTIEIGMGINTGIAIAGNVGSEKRMLYTVIGQDVNLAARLVSIAQKSEICLSDATYQKVQNLLPPLQSELIGVKGIETPLKIYRISPLSITESKT
ncbi:MAG: adenylate/guanylate cyclase domain-containing protein [Chlamydiae bacterium]|nr:adenylate/guanylate cyclase domain-containing protein [Chlamydiota bacterium]